MATAVFDDGVEDGSALARIGVAHEEPVLFANGGGSDGVLHQVVVDFDASVLKEDAKAGPLPQGVVDGFAQAALRQVAFFDFQSHQRAMDAFMDGATLRSADGGSQPGTGALLPQPPFDGVKMSDLPQEPADDTRGLFLGFDKFAARVGVASGETDLPFALLVLGEAAIARIAVALDDATELDRDDFLHALGRAARLPVENDIAAGPVAYPQVAGSCFAVAGDEVFEGRFVHLDVAVPDDALVDFAVDEAERVGAQIRPAPQGLPG